MPEHRPPPRSPSVASTLTGKVIDAPPLADYNPYGRLIIDLCRKDNGMAGIDTIRLDPVGMFTPGIIEQHVLTIAQAILRAHAINKGHLTAAVQSAPIEEELSQ